VCRRFMFVFGSGGVSCMVLGLVVELVMGWLVILRFGCVLLCVVLWFCVGGVCGWWFGICLCMVVSSLLWY